MQNFYSQSLLKTYRKKIYSKFLKALTRYNLLKENDKIAVCISGGKDSFLLAKCFSELHKYTKILNEYTPTILIKNDRTL